MQVQNPSYLSLPYQIINKNHSFLLACISLEGGPLWATCLLLFLSLSSCRMRSYCHCCGNIAITPRIRSLY